MRADYEQISELEVFDVQELMTADSLLTPFNKELDPETAATAVTRESMQRGYGKPAFCSRAEEEDLATAHYRRRLVPHVWCIASKHSKIHDEKATWLREAQRRFFLFLCGLATIVALMALGMAYRQFFGASPPSITCKIPLSAVTRPSAEPSAESLECTNSH